MTNKELEDNTSLHFRTHLNSFKGAVMLETSFSNETRQKLYAELAKIEEIIADAKVQVEK